MSLVKQSIFAAACLLTTLLGCTSQSQPSLDAIQQRVAALEAKEEIRALMQNYGRFVDDRNWEAFADLFATDGGTWDGGMGVAKGRDQIIKMMEDSIGSTNTSSRGDGYSNLHLLSNEIITVDGNKAEAISKWVFVMTATEGGPDVVFIGRYLDQFVNENGLWKFKNRKVLADITSPITPGTL